MILPPPGWQQAVFSDAFSRLAMMAIAAACAVKMYRHMREILRLRRERRRAEAEEKLQWLKRKLESENGHGPGFYG